MIAPSANRQLDRIVRIQQDEHVNPEKSYTSRLLSSHNSH